LIRHCELICARQYLPITTRWLGVRLCKSEIGFWKRTGKPGLNSFSTTWQGRIPKLQSWSFILTSFAGDMRWSCPDRDSYGEKPAEKLQSPRAMFCLRTLI